MEGQFVPPDYWHLTPLWRNWFENLTTVQFDHRVLAETTWFVIAALWLASLRAALAPAQRWALHALFFFACLQLALGITTLLTVVWLPVAVAHQAGALWPHHGGAGERLRLTALSRLSPRAAGSIRS